MALWNNSLLIGIPEIDEQHKKLVEALNELSDACFKGCGKEKIEKTLSFVAAYTKEHFSQEEVLHKRDQYPEAAEHKELHQAFIKTLADFQKDLSAEGSTADLSIKLNKVLSEWLIRHISAEDRKYATYIKSKK